MESPALTLVGPAVGVALALDAGLAVSAVSPGGVELLVIVAAMVETPLVPALLSTLDAMVASASVEAAGPELPVEHPAANTMAPHRARLGHHRVPALFVDTRQTNPVILPAKSSPNSVASTPNMLRNVVYSLL